MRLRRNGRFAYRACRRLPVGRKFCQSEIQYFGGSPLDQKNIRRLDVAVNDALGVGRFEALSDLNGDVEKLGCCQRFFRDALLEGLALKQLHHDKWAAFEFSDVVN